MESSGSSLDFNVLSKLLAPQKNGRIREFNYENEYGREDSLPFTGMPFTGENLNKEKSHIVDRKPTKCDLRNMIGNLYLGDEIESGKFEEVKYGPIHQRLRYLEKVLLEADFNIGNYHKMFKTKLRTHIHLTHKLLDLASTRMDEIEWFLLPSLISIKKWSSKIIPELKKVLAPNHPILTNFSKYSLQLPHDIEHLNIVVERSHQIRSNLKARVEGSSIYCKFGSVLDASYNRFTKSLSTFHQISAQPDQEKSAADLLSLSKSNQHNFFLHEFSLLLSMQNILKILKEDGMKATSILSDIFTMQEFVATKTLTMLEEMKSLSNIPSNKINLLALNAGIIEIEEVKKGFSSPLDLGKELGEQMASYLLKKTSLRITVPKNFHEWMKKLNDFFEHFTMNYLKKSLLLQAQIHCRTAGTNKKCLLVIDVANSY